jgi:tetratricopeptide (TPR) repeat protein
VGPVTEQSEHLSNAQIENYGNRTSGAGPDADQRDKDQTVDTPWVDDHLANCPSCRNRLLDFHRARFGLVETADLQVKTAPTSECPSEDALRQLAAGLTPDDIAPALTRHAATCDHCGPLLRTFTEDFSDDFSPEEQAVLNNLQSSSAAWQRNTARQMLKAAGAGAVATPAARAKSAAKSLGRSFSWKWFLIPATAAVFAIAVLSIWYTQRDTPEKVEKLLAQAYTEQRTIEMRVAEAPYAPLVPKERGRSTKQPSSLFDAKSKILTHLKKQPEDWRWLHQLGAQEMMERHFDDAIADLEHALQMQPASAPIMLDLATAHFERGRAVQNSNDYRQAVELLGKVLTIEPNNSVARFNRAILYEEMSPPLYDLALDDWDQYLTIDKDGPWRDEAQRRRSALEQAKKKAR